MNITTNPWTIIWDRYGHSVSNSNNYVHHYPFAIITKHHIYFMHISSWIDLSHDFEYYEDSIHIELITAKWCSILRTYNLDKIWSSHAQVVDWEKLIDKYISKPLNLSVKFNNDVSTFDNIDRIKRKMIKLYLKYHPYADPAIENLIHL